MDIHSLLTEQTILKDVEAGKKVDLFATMMGSLSDRFNAEDLESILVAVIEREAIMSTGVGKGLAIPHAKTNLVVSNHAVFAVLKEGIEFDSIDGIPVNMVFLLIGPSQNNSSHIKLLSRISRLMNSSTFRDKILECETSNEILEAFTEEEHKFFPAST